MYEKVPHAWQSAGFVPTVSFAEVQRKTSAEEDKGGVVEKETAVDERE